MNTPHSWDDDLVAVIAGLPGVKVTHHYRGREQPDNYFIHAEVENDDALHRLCRLSAYANAPLHVYEHSNTEFRYTLIINSNSREILMAET